MTELRIGANDADRFTVCFPLNPEFYNNFILFLLHELILFESYCLYLIFFTITDIVTNSTTLRFVLIIPSDCTNLIGKLEPMYKCPRFYVASS